MSTLNFSIKGVSENATRLVSKARNFSFIIDEPEELGGKDTGPNPVEYLLGSHAGCLNVVFHIVAKELGITINKLDIDIDGDIDPEKFLQGTGTNRPGFLGINININLDTNVEKAKELELIRLTKERCPVSDNLQSETPLNYKVTHSAGEVAA